MASLFAFSICLCIAICAVTFLCRGRYERRQIEERRAVYAGRAQGSVAGFEPRGSEGLGALIVEYSAFGERYRLASAQLCRRGDFEDGRTVSVLYDEGHPERFLVEELGQAAASEGERHIRLARWLALAAAVALLAALLLQGDRLRSHLHGLALQLHFLLRRRR